MRRAKLAGRSRCVTATFWAVPSTVAQRCRCQSLKAPVLAASSRLCLAASSSRSGLFEARAGLASACSAVEERLLLRVLLVPRPVEAAGEGEAGAAEDERDARSHMSFRRLRGGGQPRAKRREVSESLHQICRRARPRRRPLASSPEEEEVIETMHCRLRRAPWRAPLPSAPSSRACRPASWAAPAGSRARPASRACRSCRRDASSAPRR